MYLWSPKYDKYIYITVFNSVTMGNESSSITDTVTILTSTVEDYKHKMNMLHWEIKDHKTSNNEKQKKIEELNQCTFQLSNENGQLKSELSQLKQEHKEIQKENEDYRSIPILKDILNLYHRMKILNEKLMNEAINTNDINDKKKVFEDKITEVTNEISYLKQELKNNNIGNSFEENQLKRAEIEMNMLKEFSIQKQKERKTKLSKLKSAAAKLDDIIPTAINNVNMEINNYKQELLELKRSRPEFDERNKCALQTVLALHMYRRDQMMDLISSNKTADSGLIDDAIFHIILQNVKEEHEDFVNNKDKVLSILNLFTTIDSQFIHVHRIGKPNIQKTRPIMVSSSTPRLLSLLQHKNETKYTSYGKIIIRPFYKRPNNTETRSFSRSNKTNL